MNTQSIDPNTRFMLDGNAAAGLLQEIFAAEMTISPVCCASCGYEGELATLQLYTHGPGSVLRCPTCQKIVLRIVQTPQAIFIDARGVVCLSIPRT